MSFAVPIYKQTGHAIDRMRRWYGGEMPPGFQTRHAMEGKAVVELVCHDCHVIVARKVFGFLRHPAPLVWLVRGVKEHDHWRAWAAQRTDRP